MTACATWLCPCDCEIDAGNAGVRIERLQLRHFRCIEQAEIAPGPTLNWLIGLNGAGKTTLLESIHVLSHGHSFRSGPIGALIQRGQPAFSLYSEVVGRAGRNALGVSRNSAGWQLRLNGVDQQQLTAILERCAALCFEPEGHALITGASDVRRRFLDWGVFHVEHQFLDWWRRYRRALRQRNALLRGRGDAGLLAIWEAELDGASAPLEKIRRIYSTMLAAHLKPIAENLLPELGSVRLTYHSGWNPERSLREALEDQRDKDQELGYTRVGPHRADWRISFEKSPSREYLSRGQTKLVALSCVLAQARVFFECLEEWPILCLDDLVSELDAPHLDLVMKYVSATSAQVWITSTQAWNEPDTAKEMTMFHVEQASVLRV